MLRFYYVILKNIKRAWMIPRMDYIVEHPEKYSEEFRYRYDQKVVRHVMRTGRISTAAYGMENLPEDGGYVMFANHQGKFDALGIIYSHERPCSVVMDEKRSNGILVKQFVDLVNGKRIRLDDIKQAARIIREMTVEVRQGRRFIIFPAGGYKHRNGNHIDPVKPGCFKSAMKAKAPIVPVAIVDSWKVFDLWSLRRIRTQVYYLKPILYEEYKNLKSGEISDIVFQRICKAVWLGEHDLPGEAVEC